MAGTVHLGAALIDRFRSNGDVLRLNPQLPHELERLDMRIRYRGYLLDLR
jgi:trehalose/maltose hydrolase-like predicted phosphorylase